MDPIKNGDIPASYVRLPEGNNPIRIIPFLVGNPNLNLYLPLLLGGG